MAELADALDSGSSPRNGVQVQLLSWAPSCFIPIFYILMRWYRGASETDSGGAFGVDCFLWLAGAPGEGSSKDQIEEPACSAIEQPQQQPCAVWQPEGPSDVEGKEGGDSEIHPITTSG